VSFRGSEACYTSLLYTSLLHVSVTQESQALEAAPRRAPVPPVTDVSEAAAAAGCELTTADLSAGSRRPAVDVTRHGPSSSPPRAPPPASIADDELQQAETPAGSRCNVSRPHRMHAVQTCGLVLRMSLYVSVGHNREPCERG